MSGLVTCLQSYSSMIKTSQSFAEFGEIIVAVEHVRMDPQFRSLRSGLQPAKAVAATYLTQKSSERPYVTVLEACNKRFSDPRWR